MGGRSMNTEQQRIAIAQACGYKDVAIRLTEGTIKVMTGFKNHRFDEEVPDYLNDLNAMHEAELALGLKYDQWTRELRGVCERERRCVESATAPQRAEAFLRTLGLREEK